MASTSHNGAPSASTTNLGSPVIRKAHKVDRKRGIRSAAHAATKDPTADAAAQVAKIAPSTPAP